MDEVLDDDESGSEKAPVSEESRQLDFKNRILYDKDVMRIILCISWSSSRAPPCSQNGRLNCNSGDRTPSPEDR